MNQIKIRIIISQIRNRKDHVDRKNRVDHLDLKDHLDRKARVEKKDLQAVWVRWVQLARWDQEEIQENKGHRDIWVLKETQEK